MKKRFINTTLIVLVVTIWVFTGRRFIKFSEDEIPETVEVIQKASSHTDPMDLERLKFVYNKSIRNPFDTYEISTATQEKPAHKPAKKFLKNPYKNTRLQGVLLNGAESIAIISQDQNTYYLHVGDSLNGGELTEVKNDSVIFRYHDNLWRVKL